MSTSRIYKGISIMDNLTDYTVIDLETTDRYIDSLEIIELAAVRVRNGEIVDQFNRLVKPCNRISAKIESLTGISNEMVENAPDISEVLPLYIDFIGNDIVLGHNINAFDVNVIYDHCEKLGLDKFSNDFLDTYQYSLHCNLDVFDHKLTTLTAYFCIDHENAHRALGDCIANYECYEKLKELYSEDIVNRPCKSKRASFRPRYSEDTRSLRQLSGIVEGMICDNILSDGEIHYLQNWLNANKQLAGNFPYDVISDKLYDILEDNIITNEERSELLDILTDYINPVDRMSESLSDEDNDLCDKTVCLSGVFSCGSRTEITEKLTANGAIVKDTVTKKTDYLIVGGLGNDSWACGNYGTKVKKALELQSKGGSIKILKEEELPCLKG